MNLFGQMAGEPGRVADVRGLIASVPPDAASRPSLEKLLSLLEGKFNDTMPDTRYNRGG